MLVSIHPDAFSACHRGAEIVAALIRAKPDAAIGLAAGATPLPLYDRLLEILDPARDFARLHLFGLDEYWGLAQGHPVSCAWTLRQRLVDRVAHDPARVRLFDGGGADPHRQCAEHDAAIAACGGLDLQILGIGVNGHVGFNEPGCSLGGRTRLVALRSSTRRTNRPLFGPGEEVPAAAVTMGLGTILAARRILLLATGPSKTQAVVKAVEGPLTALVPASALQLHPDAVILADEAAAAELALRDDYRAEAELIG